MVFSGDAGDTGGWGGGVYLVEAKGGGWVEGGEVFVMDFVMWV